MKIRLVAPFVAIAALFAPAFTAFAAPSEVPCVLQSTSFSAQIAFYGITKAQTCAAAVQAAGPSAFSQYMQPSGLPECLVEYAAADNPLTVTEGAIVMENGDGSAPLLCSVYANNPILFVYTPSGAAYSLSSPNNF